MDQRVTGQICGEEWHRCCQMHVSLPTLALNESLTWPVGACPEEVLLSHSIFISWLPTLVTMKTQN